MYVKILHILYRWCSYDIPKYVATIIISVGGSNIYCDFYSAIDFVAIYIQHLNIMPIIYTKSLGKNFVNKVYLHHLGVHYLPFF